MKRLLFVLAITCIGKFSLAQEAYLTRSFKSENIKSVESVTSGGNISIEKATDGPRVEVYVQASSWKKTLSKEEIEKRMELYDLTVAVDGSKLSAIAKPRKRNMNWKEGLSISFKIYVEKEIESNLTTSGGNIDLRGISGEQEATTSGGNITVNDVKGKVKGITSGGNVSVDNSGNDIELITSGGNVHANNCMGEIKLTTSGGNVDLGTLNGNINAATSGGNVKGHGVKGDLKAHTSGGNVDLYDLACNVTAGTSGGDVRVAITEPGKFVKLGNSGGKIELELPAGKGYDFDLNADKIKTNGLVNFSGKVEDDQLRGKVNGGGTMVTVDAGSSRLVLTMK